MKIAILQQYHVLLEKAGAFDKVANQKHAFPVAVSLVISQGPESFKQSRAIRQQILERLPVPYTPPQLVEILPNVRGLSTRKRLLLEQVAECFSNNEDDWKRLPGIGPWTLKGFEIMTSYPSNENIALKEDGHVRKRMAAVGITWQDIPRGWETRTSRLFWRLTDHGQTALVRYLAENRLPTHVERNEFY
jgi:hypothetical protein